MVDNLSKKQRSYCMSRIRSKWTSQEKKIHNYLKGHKIKHKMHPKIIANPDILLLNSNTAVFLHGCFWHKCPKCYREPKTNKEYWLPKIEKNVKRDRRNMKELKTEGYNVVRLWEHELKKEFNKKIDKLLKKYN